MVKNLTIGLFVIITITLLIFGHSQWKKAKIAESELNRVKQIVKEQQKIGEFEKKLADKQTERLQKCEKKNQELELKLALKN
ncbi:MAG: hypothetical protein C0523_07735 [Cytophaga sp.]|nr:hypothetical protein [Cytophaga sp.]